MAIAAPSNRLYLPPSTFRPKAKKHLIRPLWTHARPFLASTALVAIVLSQQLPHLARIATEQPPFGCVKALLPSFGLDLWWPRASSTTATISTVGCHIQVCRCVATVTLLATVLLHASFEVRSSYYKLLKLSIKYYYFMLKCSLNYEINCVFVKFTKYDLVVIFKN